MQELGAGFVRLDFNWYDIEPNCSGFANASCYVWGPYDGWVQAADAAGLQIFATLAYTPSWATSGSGGCKDNDERPSSCHAPTNIVDWYRFVYAVALRYPSIGHTK